jgi:nitrous oxide reductase accessory protein NosL
MPSVSTRCDRTATPTPVTRRRVLLASAGTAAASVAGCLGGGEAETPDPVTVPEEATCDVCGMVIRQHPGPTAEIFYRDRDPNGHDNPARFDSVWEAYQYEFEKDGADWEDTAFYVTDHSTVEYETVEDGSDTLISRHYEASSFAAASDVTYVVGSEVKGTMGRDLIGFSDRSDAEAFHSEWGGSLTTHAGVTPEVVAGLGR